MARLHTQTEGNPLFVTEVVRLLVQEGELTQQNVGDRNETLTVAAVVCRQFTLTQLESLIDDLTQDKVLDVLEEALTSWLIEELPTSVGLYQFTHALMHETLVDELSLTRRVRLHARIAETPEALYGASHLPIPPQPGRSDGQARRRGTLRHCLRSRTGTRPVRDDNRPYGRRRGL